MGLHVWTTKPARLAARILIVGLAAAIVLSLAFVVARPLLQPPTAHAARMQYDEFWRQSSAADFGAWSGAGAGVNTAGALALAPISSGALTCTPDQIDSGAASYNSAVGLCAGTDPLPAGGYNNGLNYYNGGSFSYGVVTAPIHTTGAPFNHVIASWDAATPTGTWIETHVRVNIKNSGWTHWYALPIWASDFSTITRHSVNGQNDTDGGVATDTFFTKPGQVASAYQLSLTLFTTTPGVSPTVRLVSAIASYDATQFPTIAPDPSVWGTNLPVPQRSQMLPQYQGLGFGGGGEVWCSPTSTSMVMAYWANVTGQTDLTQAVPDAAEGTYDYAYGGTGNWPNNTAYAARYGLTAFVTRMDSMSQIEQWIKAGVPIVISVVFNNGQLPGEPVKNSPGHLLVVRGFTANGDVITNDPAASTDAGVQIVYTRASLENVWLSGSNGTAYVIYPTGWATPTATDMGNW